MVLISAIFTAILGLALVLTLASNFCWRFHFKASKKSKTSEDGTRDFQNTPPFKRSACFNVTISENFERFHYFNFKTDFLEKEKLSKKTRVTFFS